ncbi:tyrosine-protein kinase SYK-like [Anneissia japonica]|uniref:tyrosine-protein kinase SYK-like n=1 Tax=Anneissia japonica TaxID=1529436 RepID=UPI001425ADC6|nr:tyrosine-protein kinase SYK-like [Anneissia japonica]
MLTATLPQKMLKLSEKIALPVYLQKLDDILPKNIKPIVSTRDLYPVVVSGEQVQLGKGAYGEVWLERLECNGPLVAVKSCDITGQGDREKQLKDKFLVSLEARVLAFLSKKSRAFPYVYGICEKVRFGTRKSIIIEYVGHPTKLKSVTLYKAIFFKDPHLTISNALRVAHDIAEGVQVMHQNGFIHSDLASRNILLHHDGKRWTAKITDFGSISHVSAPFDFFQLHKIPAEQRQQCIAAHREYAPELFFSNAPPNFACDMHSTGNMFLEMGSNLQIKFLSKLGKLCTHIDPKRRPVIDVIVKMLANKINTGNL